jgi:hypothetical protein
VIILDDETRAAIQENVVTMGISVVSLTARLAEFQHSESE